jgi:hypothetical protein
LGCCSAKGSATLTVLIDHTIQLVQLEYQVGSNRPEAGAHLLVRTLPQVSWCPGPT